MYSPPYTAYPSRRTCVPDIRSPPATISSWGTVPTHPPPPPHHVPFYPGSPYSGSGSPVPSSNGSIASASHAPSWRSPSPYDVRYPHRFHPQLVAQPFKPQSTRMRLAHEAHPSWFFDIEKPSEILIEDILNMIYYHFNDSLQSRRFMAVPLEAAQNAARNFERRVALSRADFAGGVRRLDCLDFKFNFIGLTQTRSGTWLIHFS